MGSFPCHPTVMGADNLAISADLSGAFRRQMRALLGTDIWVALATGASGNISTRHARKGQHSREMLRLGRLSADQAQVLIRQAQPLVLATPIVRDEHVVLNRKAVLDEASLEVAATAVREQRATRRFVNV